jgi:hypothetical protein
MGLFGDLMQQSQLSEQENAAQSLEERVTELETQLLETRTLQHRLLQILETHFECDVDGDGKVG